MSNRVALKIDRRWVVRGMWLGLLLLAVGFFAFQAPWPIFLGTGPHSIMAPLMRNGGLTLLGLLLFPGAALLFGAVVAAARHRDHSRWIAMAIGAVVAVVSLVLIVAGATGAMALIAVIVA